MGPGWSFVFCAEFVEASRSAKSGATALSSHRAEITSSAYCETRIESGR